MKGQLGGLQVRVCRHQMDRQNPIPQADLSFLDDCSLADAEMVLAVAAPVALGYMAGMANAREEDPFRSAGRTPDLGTPPDRGQPQGRTVFIGKGEEEFGKGHVGTCGRAAAKRPLQGCHRDTRGTRTIVTVG